MRFIAILLGLVVLAGLGVFVYLAGAAETLEPQIEERRVPIDF